MRSLAHRFGVVVLAFAGLVPCGCLGVAQNPSYFPYWLPTGDIIRNHAKPGGIGYFRNFDPKAIEVQATPTSANNPTRAQVPIIATVVDSEGNPRRKRRIEWVLDGPGSIVEVDESGYTAGRGYKVDNKYAVSYTDYLPHTITRGNDDPRDDFELKPGQSWCVVSSPVEGETTITVYAPEVHDWDKSRAYVKLTWGGGEFRIDPASKRRAPTDELPALPGVGTLPTATDRLGPPTGKLTSNTPGKMTLAIEAPGFFTVSESSLVQLRVENTGGTDLDNVTAWLDLPPGLKGSTSANPVEFPIGAIAAGESRSVSVPLKAERTGRGVVKVNLTADGGATARAETPVSIGRANLELNLSGPADLPLGQEGLYELKISNPGDVPIANVTARASVPRGLSVKRATDDGRANPDGATWNLGTLAAGQTRTVRLTTVGESLSERGTLTATAGGELVSGTRVADQRQSTTVAITGTPVLVLEFAAPTTTVPVNGRAAYRIVVRNRGTGPATNIEVSAEVSGELRPTRGTGPNRTVGKLTENEFRFVTIPTLPAGQTATYQLEVEATRAGDARATAKVTSGDIRLREEQPTRIGKPVR